MVFTATFNNISVISWRSVLLVEETRVPRENHWPAASHRQTLSHNVASSTPRLSGILTHNVSGDRHWLHMLLEIQLPYDHDYDGPLISTQEKPTPVTAQIFVVTLGNWQVKFHYCFYHTLTVVLFSCQFLIEQGLLVHWSVR